MQPDWRREVECYARKRFAQQADYLKEKTNCTAPFNYRLEHTLNTVGLAMTLAGELGCDPNICWCGAWLHDLGKCYDPQYSEAENKQRFLEHGAAGALEAKEFLRGTGLNANFVDEVCVGIAQHVGLKRRPDEEIKPLSARILWDADKLSKIGITAWLHYLIHCCETGGEVRGSLVAMLNDNGLKTMEEIQQHLHFRVARQLAERRLQHFKKQTTIMKAMLAGEY